MFVVTGSGCGLAALRRNRANVLRISVSVLFL
jgi:hypothetical protein